MADAGVLILFDKNLKGFGIMENAYIINNTLPTLNSNFKMIHKIFYGEKNVCIISCVDFYYNFYSILSKISK